MSAALPATGKVTAWSTAPTARLTPTQVGAALTTNSRNSGSTETRTPKTAQPRPKFVVSAAR